MYRLTSIADDDRVSTLVRGGPNAHVLTSWLQIQSLQQNDQGIYTCVASNTLGKTEKSCTIFVEGRSIYFYNLYRIFFSLII